MRFVARLAIANAVRGMLESEGSPSIGVALHASHLSGEAGPQLAAFQSPMRLVTVDTTHCVLRHTMMEGLGKVGSLLNMTAQAERVRRFLQNSRHRSGIVDLVAVRA